MDELDSVCQRKKRLLEQEGTWSTVTAFCGGTEPQAGSFRCDALVDSLVNKYIGKHVIPMMGNNTPASATNSYWRAIYEDETGSIPFTMSSENLEFFDAANALGTDGYPHYMPLPADAIDNELRGRSDFLHLTPVTGYPFVEYRNGIPNDTITSDYHRYLALMQFHLDRDGFVDARYPAAPKYTTESRVL